MSIKKFFQNLVGPSRAAPRHDGHELSKQMREATGPQAGGEGTNRPHPGATIKHFEKKNPPT